MTARKYAVGTSSKYCIGELIWVKIVGEESRGVLEATITEISERGGLDKLFIPNPPRSLRWDKVFVVQTQAGKARHR